MSLWLRISIVRLMNFIRRSKVIVSIGTIIIFGCFVLLFSKTTISFKINNSNNNNNLRHKRNTARNFSKLSQTAAFQATTGMIPALYGTAWKKSRTKELVELAILTGFRAIDTACQPKHYYEPGVGEALTSIYEKTSIRREDIFIQTKFTSVDGQDPNNIPYDKTQSLHNQVLESFKKSCENLKTTYIDSYIMHSPMPSLEETMEVWYTFEQIHQEGKVKNIGISNIYNLNLLQNIYSKANVKPKFIQNRFYKQSSYDKGIREFCRSNGIQYQSFWTLTGNPHIISRYVNISLLAIPYTCII